MNPQEHLITCLAEEATEVALELAKVGCKALRFGAEDRNALNPTGSTNAEKLVSELNDLIAVADMLAIQGVIPLNWFNQTQQDAKKQRLEKFIAYAKEQGALQATPFPDAPNPTQQWISCETNLPTEDGHYLTWTTSPVVESHFSENQFLENEWLLPPDHNTPSLTG